MSNEESVAEAGTLTDEGQVESQPETVDAQTQEAAPPPQSGLIKEEDFRAHQSVMDRKVSERDNQIRRLQKQIEELRLASVPEDQRELEQLRLENEQLRQQSEAAQRFQVLNEISQDFGVPIDAMAEATSTMHAQQLALLWLRDNNMGNTGTASASPSQPVQQPPAEHQAFVAPEQPGKPQKRNFTEELNEAMQNRDMRAYNKIVREAREAGLDV